MDVIRQLLNHSHIIKDEAIVSGHVKVFEKSIERDADSVDNGNIQLSRISQSSLPEIAAMTQKYVPEIKDQGQFFFSFR